MKLLQWLQSIKFSTWKSLYSIIIPHWICFVYRRYASIQVWPYPSRGACLLKSVLLRWATQQAKTALSYSIFRHSLFFPAHRCCVVGEESTDWGDKLFCLFFIFSFLRLQVGIWEPICSISQYKVERAQLCDWNNGTSTLKIQEDWSD